MVFTQRKCARSKQPHQEAALHTQGYGAELWWVVLTLAQAPSPAHCVLLIPRVLFFPGQDVPAAPACSLQPAGLVLPLQVVLPPLPAPEPRVELQAGHADPRHPGHLPVCLHRLHRRPLAPQPPRSVGKSVIPPSPGLLPAPQPPAPLRDDACSDISAAFWWKAPEERRAWYSILLL